MTLSAFLPVLIQLLLAVLLAAIIVSATRIFGQKARGNPIKDSPYECGLIPEGEAHPRFAVKFYVTAMLFILFDVEVVFLFPWALIYREFLRESIPILTPMLFFLGLLVLGLAYEIRKGALEWER